MKLAGNIERAAGLVEAHGRPLPDLAVKRSGGRGRRAFRVADVGHHRDRQIEVRRQLGRHGNRQFVDAGLQLDQPVAEHPRALESHQRQRGRFAPMNLHRRPVAHLVTVGVGQDPQPHLVLIA